MAMLDAVKAAMGITKANYDTVLNLYISAALADLKTSAGVTATVSSEDPNIVKAVCTYCRFSHGSPADYANLKASYDEQKAQLAMATGYGLPEEE